MTLPTSFAKLLDVFRGAMTRPTFAKLQTLILGWIFAPRRNVMTILRAAAAKRHHAAFHRVFSSARWSADQVGLAVLQLILEVTRPFTVMMTVDDSFFAHWGSKIFGAGMHRDPLLSTRRKAVLRWGHCWVVLCVLIERPWAKGRFLALPVLARLYLNQKTAARCRRVYRTKTDLMRELVRLAHEHVGGRKIHLLGDCLFSAPAVLESLPKDVEMTGRVRLDSRLRELPPPPPPHRPGRHAKRGPRLPNPRQMLQGKPLAHLKIHLPQREFDVRVAEKVCIFHKAPSRKVKVVAVEHLRGKRDQEVFYSTVHEAAAESILRWFSRRGSQELMWRDVKQHLGAGQGQGRTRGAAERMALIAFWLYSLVTLWHEYLRKEPAAWIRSWRRKAAPSFAEMLAALRLETLRHWRVALRGGATQGGANFVTSSSHEDVTKYLDYLESLVALGA
jgi:hypothetical protein